MAFTFDDETLTTSVFGELEWEVVKGLRATVEARYERENRERRGSAFPGKKKLILSGFHETALAAFGVHQHLYPDKKVFLQYTTTSPIMHKRLGVGAF